MSASHSLLDEINLAWNTTLKPSQRLQLAKLPNWRAHLPPPCSAVAQWTELTLDWLEGPGGAHRHVLGIHHPLYPASLLDLKDPPLVLFVEGAVENLHQPGLAMVGSRNSTRAGAQLAHDFAQHLSAAGWMIFSGLAEGIDAHAHAGALQALRPNVAVLGSAVNRIYPKHHGRLAQQILAQQGTLVSEYPPGTEPQTWFFPRRNRIIAGLADGVLVVEAAVKSGSLITARVSSELGRPVMAIPGSIHSPHSKGCHAMIKQGALLVETAQEVESELRAVLAPEKMAMLHPGKLGCTRSGDSEDQVQWGEWAWLMAVLHHEPQTVDTLVTLTGRPADELLAALTELELEGWVLCEPGNRWVKHPKL